MDALRNLAVRIYARIASQDGATAVEYGIMVGLIAAVIVTAVSVLGGQVKGAFCTVVGALNLGGIAGSCPP